MSKIKAIGNKFIQVEGTLFNLSQFKEIEKYQFGYDEDPDGNSAYGIVVTPLNPDAESIENGVDGSYFITTYLENQSNDFENDFETIISALKD